MADQIERLKENMSVQTVTTVVSCNKMKGLNIKFPKSFTLTVSNVANDNFTGAVLKDACDLFTSLGIFNGAGVEEFDVKGAVTVENVQRFLQTYRGSIKLINYQCKEDAGQLDNNINIIQACIDGTSANVATFDVAEDRRNTQYQEGLMTVFPPKGTAWLTNTSGITVASDDQVTKTINLTLAFDAWEAYTDLVMGN